MDLFDVLLIVGLMIGITILYVGIRKFLAWTLDDDNQWHKKQGCLGYSKKETENKKKLVYDRLTFGYLLFMGVLVLLLILPLITG